jgi:N-acetylneuraminic acid mutarotase
MDSRSSRICSAVAFAAIGLASCGDGGGSPAPVTVGGTVLGLTGSGLVLTNNGTDPLSVPRDGPFTFAVSVPEGAGYSVSVLTQPLNPSQTCAVANGTAQATAGGVKDVAIRCTTNEYTLGGVVAGLGAGRSVVLQNNGGETLTATASGAFAFASGIPNGTAYDVTVTTQPAGQICVVAVGSGTMPATNTSTVTVTCTTVWTWVSGANTANASGAYGTLGTGTTTNVPGAREGGVSWTDGAGHLWLFGGTGVDSTGVAGYLNDLWEYDPSSRQWTWRSGANTAYASGIGSGTYGTLGVGSTRNVPPARFAASSWIDTAGNLWLFGGLPDGGGFPLNDLWKYAPSTRQWTWMGGADTTGAIGTYGTLGVGSTTNVPGARQNATSWNDGAGNFWLFGGQGYGTNGFGLLNDLWKYTPSSQQWTWVSGANTADPDGSALGTYGTLGVGSMNNVPGGRFGAVGWIDNAGDLWLFGGSLLYAHGQLNDLWQYTPSTGQWTWVSGANTVNGPGTYGTRGTGSTTNVPGARYRPVSWTDNAGNLWLLGGFFNDSTGAFGMLNDLWKYTPSSQQWTWVSGANMPNDPGVYGTVDIASTDDVPAARELAVSWTDGSGSLWLFGGAGPVGLLNDLWRY